MQLYGALGGTAQPLGLSTGEPVGWVYVTLPSDMEVMAINLLISASGAADVQVIPLMSLEQVDRTIEAADVYYRPPGE